ncbi:MAG: rhamnogalacturonan lyase [Edaphocola sp.]
MGKNLVGSLLVLCSMSAGAQRLMETVNRNIVATPMGGGNIFVNWRLLATDDPDIGFNLYRITAGKKVKLNKQAITAVTGFIDSGAGTSTNIGYVVKPIVKGHESNDSASFTLNDMAKPYLSVPLQMPPGYSANDGSVADLDGDGQYELILHVAGQGHDNSQSGYTDPPMLQAYKLDGSGTLLWTIRLGKNIREGAHYTQFIVYDLDCDGKAEVAVKTADGTIDGVGNVIGDSSKDWRNEKGYILQGPEYLTVFNGLTGAAMHTVDFWPPRAPTLTPTTKELKEMWGDGYGNRVDRFLGAVAYLDGVHPSLVMSRGYYNRIVITAWDLKDKKLQKHWVFDTDKSGNGKFAGQGNHNLSIADVDGDGKDEIVFGAMCVDDNGKGLYATGFGHGDALHVSDLDPSLPGLEAFDIQERFDDAGCSFRNAGTGEVYWKKPSVKAGEDGEGPGRGLALDIDPRYPGCECWVAGAGIKGLFDCKGNVIATPEKAPPCNMGIYWDGDFLGELLNGTKILKWDYENSKTKTLLNTADYQCKSNNGSKANPVLSADIFGDWREEVIYATSDSKELRIFSTPIPTDLKFYSLMDDPQYRLSIVWQNVGYNQPPHLGFYLDPQMKKFPKPNVTHIKAKD